MRRARTMTKDQPHRTTVRRADQIDPDQPGTYRVVQIPRVDRTIWRYRWQLAPAGAGLLGWAAAVGLGRSVFWSALALLGVAGLVQHATRGLRTEERVYAWAAYTAGTGWAALVALTGVHRWGVVSWAVLVVAGGVPWWRHRRVRARIHLDRTMRAWPGIADRSALAGVRAVSARMDGAAEVLRLEVQRGRQTVQDVAGRLVHLAQVMGLPVRGLRLVPDPDDPGLVDLYMVRDDPFRSQGQPVDQPHPAIADPAGWAAQDRTIRQPAPYGKAQTDGVAQLALWTVEGGRILAVVGKKGSGKSVTVHSLLAALAPCRDVRIIGLDVPKRGKTLRPWVTRLHRLATTPAEAITALDEVMELIGQRGAADGAPVHQPTPNDPAYVVVVEELGATVEQHGEIGALLASIGRVVRSASVSLILVDQRPDHTTWPAVLRSNVDDVIAGRMGRGGDARLILPGHAQVDLTAIPVDMPGQMVQQLGPGDVTPIRSWRLEQADDIAAIVAAAMTVISAATVGGEPANASRSTSAEVAMATPTSRHRTSAADAHQRVAAALDALEHDHTDRPPIRGSIDQLAAGHTYAEPTPRPGDDTLDRAILTAARQAADDGIGVSALVQAVRAPRATVQRRAGALRRTGHLDLRPERGPTARWYTTHSHPTPNA